ncbi:PLxRFG domain-containing protein [Neisseria polysaccharea]|uniref:PLxRFG domain-containing protein n=1 Tax=Neisseria polysaccharea TaxID=489 RepID=UPI0027E1E05F|nr:PLxRFG domain-containing protein [Neisseria polysaccharea]
MSDLVRYDPLEHGQLVGGLKKYRGLTQKEARAAADDTALTRGFNNSMRSARMAWNAFTGDKEELGQLKAEDMDYRKIQEGRKSQARRELGEAWDKGEGVGGGLSNVWGELKKDWREKGLDGVLEDVGEMGGATLEQAPNALVPIATTTVGGILGTLAGGNTAVGAYAGATLGNTLMEYGEQLDRAAEAAGVDPTDKDAMMAFIDRGAPGALKNAAVKGAVVGAVDMATMKLGGSILNMGKKAAEKAALKKMGVAAADKAAVAAAKGTPEFAALAKESAKGGLGGAARHAAAFALEPASEFAGEYLGTGLANGEWDEKGAALEAFSSLGHSAVEFVGTKAYAAMTDPLRLSAGQKADALADAKGNIEGNRKAGKLTPEEAQALRVAVEAALDGGVEQGGAGFDTAHHDQLYLTLQQFVDRTKQKEAEQFFSSPADSNTPHAEEWAREMEKQPDVSGIPSEDEAEFLNTGVMSDSLARQYADMAAKYRAKPSEAMGINPDDGAISAAAALAVDSGAAVPSAVSDDVEAPSVADDVLSGRSADADRGGVSSDYGNVRSGGASRGAASVASGGSAAAPSGGIARVAPLPAGQYFDGLDTLGRKALAKEAGFDIKGVADFGQIAEPVRQKIEQAYHARIEADYKAASEAKQGYLPPPVRMADAVPVPKKGFSVPADALNKESRRRFDALPEGVRRHAQTVADYTADGIMRQEAGMADMRGHYPAGLAESVRAVRAYRAEHPESADVLDRLNRAVYGYRRNNGWSVPLLSLEGERLQGGRTALPDDGASEAVVGGGRGLPRALPTEDKGLAQDVRQGLTQGGRGLTPDTGADANAAALQGLPASAAVASGNAPTHRQNLQVWTRAEGAAPGLPASENLAETDGGKRAPVAGKRPDTVLPVLNPQVAESAVKVSPKKRMADAAADFTRRLAADRRKLEKAGVPLGDGEYRFEHTNRKHIDALAGVLDRLGKGGMLEEFADMAGSSHSDGLVFDGRRYLKGKEAETLQAGGLLEAVPSKSGWDYRLTQEGRALAKVMARSRDAAADGKSAGKAQSARAKDAPVAGKAAVAKNATTEKPSSDKAAKPETLVKTALDNPEEAQRKARVLQGEPVYTVKERTAPQGFKALREWAAALFEKAGGKAVNPEAGEILLNERSVRDSIAHGMNPFKAEAFAAIPDVISQGVVIHEGVNPENGTRYVYISAPVEIEGKDDVVTLLARNTGNGSQMYLHSVATKESILNASDTETAEISRETGKVNSGYIASVLKKLLEYKTETGKGVSVGKKQQKRQAESEAGSVPSEAQPKSGKDYFGLSLYESGQDYKGISEAHYRKFVAELSKLDGWRVNNRKYGRLEFRVDGEEVVFLRRLESLYSEHAVIGFSVYNSRLVEKKFDEIEFVFNPSEPPKETAERLNRFIRSIYPVSEASVQVESNPESEADTHRTPESVRAFSVTLPKLQQKRAVEHLTADALLDGGAKYPQLNGRTTKAGQVEKTLSAGFVPYEEIREQTARMGKERDKMFFKLHREAYGEDSSFDYDNSDDAELKAQTDEALREKHPPKTVYLMKHKQSGDALPITKTQFDYAVYLENMPSEGLRFSLNESPDSAFARAVDDVTGGKVPAGFISLGTTPDVWKLVGLPDGKVRISGGVIDKAMNGKHSVTAEALKDLPRHLNSPIAVFKSSASSSNPDGYVVLTELVEREKGKDKPIIAALNLGRAKNGLELLDISSVYGRGNGQLTRAFNQDLLYLDKAKGRHFLTTRPLQLHWDITSDADLVGRNIKTDSDLAQYSSAKKQVPVDKAQRMARQHAESIKKRLAESIGGLAEQVDVAAVSETAPDKAQMLLSERVEGWFDGRTGKITMVAENLTPERAVWVAWHELGHRGFAADGFAKYREELERADGNSLIRRIADAVQEEREGTGDAAASVRSVAVEEVVVELYAAQRTGDWSGIENRYGVKVGNGLKRGIAGVLARIGAVLRRVLQRLAGKADGAMSDADVFAMLADLHGNAEGARDASSDGVKPSRSAMKDTDANIRRGRAAMNRALVEKADVRRAMYRNDIGWIDFVWGSTGRVLPNGKTKGAMGLAHVIESRMRKDGMSRDEVVGMLTNDIVEAIARGKVYKHVVNGNSERLQLRHNGYEANLIKNAGNNAWLITGYELYQNGADGVGFDTSAATHTTPTPARRDVGASDTPNVRAKDESVNTADGTRNSRAAERSKSESLEKLRRAETIRISGREIEAGDDLRQYRRRAMEYGKSLRGSYVNKDTGREISLGRAGITEVLHHDVSNPEHLQSIAAIPQIIEKSIYIDTLPNEDKAKNPDIQEYEYYVAGLNIGGTDYTVKAAIAVATTGDKYYDHKLTRIEKGDLLEMTSRLSGAEISNQSPLSSIDDKRLLQILQDKDADKGGIADFDTEAVRFSRAANIGAAISHITGKKSDLRNALKDRWDASKGIQLQFLGRRQIEDIYGGSLDGLKEYGRLSELFGADANKAVTEADKVVREWGRLKKADAKALADLMHDATLAKVDADPLMRADAQKRLDGIRTALDIADGKIEKAKAVIASANGRIARADAAYNKASEAAKKAQSALLAAEEKAGREILADEADMRLRRLFYADSEAKRALRHAQADVMAESRAKTDAVQMLKQARADVRRLEKDEVGAQKALEGLALLNRRFAKLPDAAQKVYRKARDDYRAHFGQVRDAIAERLERAGQDAEIVRRLKERFDNELGGVYFPLARFGDYLVVVKDADGNNVNVSRAETLSEAEKLRDALKADFGAGFKVSPVMKSRDYIQSRDAVGSGFMKELGEAVGMLDLDPAQQAQLNDTLTQLYLNSLPDTSWAKHGIHRKGVPGFSDDARRAYAQNMGSGANYLAKLRYADRMAEQLDVMQDFVDGRKYEEGFNQRQLQRVADEMRKRHEAVMNPNPSKLAQALTGFGFLWMMGMSPASAIVNLSQTAMVAYPVMAAKWGYADAARELLRASKQIGLRVGEKFNTIEDSLNEDEKAAFQKAVDYGVIDLSQAHDLAGVANGDPGLAGSAWQKVMDKASWLFHHAEKFNRQVTFVAAYRLAKQAGADSDTAFEQAKKATYDGHFDYAAQNRPRFMMGNVAKVVFLFKQYSQNILYALGRNAYLAFKGDKEARKTLAGLLASHAMASGILGLPFVSTLLAVASMLGSDDDDPWDAEAALRNMLADTFGDKAGEVMAKGFSRLTPLDVSGRLGLNQLIFPDIQDGLEGKKWAESLVVGSTGAVVGAGIGAADGVQKILDGRYMEGLESMLPVAIRNPLKAVRYATDGQVDKSGITVKDDFNLFELAGQAAGFRSSDLALKQEGKSAVYRRDRALSAARAKILSAMAKAVVEQDAAALRELRGVVAQWNRKHPERAIKSENIMAGVRNRQRRVAGAKDGIYLSDRHSDARTDGGFAFGH